MKAIPTIRQLYDQLGKGFKNKLGLNYNKLRTVLDAISAVVSAQLKIAYLYINDIRKNTFPDTADPEEDGGELTRMGLIYLGRYPFPATDGIYKLKISGVVNSEIRSGLTFKSNDDATSMGKMFITDESYILTGANDFIEIRSLESGLDSLLSVGDHLTITEPVIGVDFDTEVTQVLYSPTSAEPTEDYRRAILNVLQIEPRGGSKGDYMLWAKDANGVKNVYPYVKSSDAGVIQIFVEAQPINSTDGNGTPTTSILNEVKDVIETDPDESLPIYERSRKPMQAFLEVRPIVLRPVDVEITGMNVFNQSIYNVVKSNLVTYVRTVRPFIDGAMLLRDRNDFLYDGKLQAEAADSLNAGNFFANLQMEVDGNEESQFQFTNGNIPYLRTLIINGQQF